MKKLVFLPFIVLVLCLKAENYPGALFEKNEAIMMQDKINGIDNGVIFKNGAKFYHSIPSKNNDDCKNIKAGSAIRLTNTTITPQEDATEMKISVTYVNPETPEEDKMACFFPATIHIGGKDIMRNVIYYDGQYFIQDNPDNPIHALSTPKSGIKNVAQKTRPSNTYAMVADPGLKFVIDLSSNESLLQNALRTGVTKIQARVLVSVLNREGVEDPFQSYLLLTMDGNGAKLDISEPMKFVVPFVDVDWEKFKDYEHDLIYNIIVTVYNAEGFSIDLPPDYPGKLEKSQKSSGKFVSGYIPSQMPEGMPARHEEDGIRFENVIYGKDGVWFDLHYPGNEATPVYLVAPNGASTNFAPYYSSYGNHTLDELAACYLPYPRIEGYDPLDHVLSVNYNGKSYRFSPKHHKPDIELYEGLLLIKTVNLGTSGESNSDSDDLEETISGFRKWLRDLFKKK